MRLQVVVPRSGTSLAAGEIVAHCRRSLGGYRVPRRVEPAVAPPRNLAGKVLKRELHAPYWQGRPRSMGSVESPGKS
jgi:acyl-CoA synthetase (AMP-forming)/AMP-acid ligase II